MSEVMKLQVDTGAITVDVEDEKGNSVGQFEFNPADSNILKRYGAVVDFFNAVTFDDTLPEDEQITQMNKLADDIGAQFDFLLGYPVAESVFRRCGPLSVMRNGEFFFESVLEGIGGIIEKVTAQRLDKKLKKISKAAANAPKRVK